MAVSLEYVKRTAFWAGPLLGLICGLLLSAAGWSTAASLTGGLALLCAIWWIFEPIPIPATSLIPLGVFPLLGILDKHQVAAAYGSPLILLLLGGFMLSKAMEKSGAHRRVALGMVNLFGGSGGRQLIFGFMAASALLSMWISNTATTLMLLPVALAVIEQAKDKQLAIPLLLGIAFAASLGGMGTPIGTPPNIIFMKVYEDSTGEALSFIQWMKWGVPVVIVFLPLMALWLTRRVTSSEVIEIPKAGEWRTAEKRVFAVFALTAIAWMTLKEPFGGWGQWLPHANHAAVALTAVIFMFVISDGKGGRLLDWDSVSTIPWGVLILFAGGIAIAKAFEITGLSVAIGNQLSGLTDIHPLLLMLSICLCVTFLTELTSNTATTTLLMPILAATAIGAGIDPVVLMVPAAMSASCAFMLPVATAPNAIMFGTGRVTVKRMAQEGFVLNLVGAVVISVICFLLL